MKTLMNEYKIPSLGFGTWQAENGDAAFQSVKAALEAGYRHIDTAAAYGNEESIGKAVKESGIDRNEIFVTSKVWNTNRGYEKTMQAFEDTMKKLDLEYLDLYLIHWPANEKQFANWNELNLDTWRAMIDIYKSGRVKAIGVSNFLTHHLKPLMETEIVPMVNQIEFHPGYMQEEIVAFCKANNIVVEAWSPLGEGLMLKNELLKSIAEKYNKSVAQVCIRWCMQNGTIPLPKSVTPSRIQENREVFDFVISEEDMETINEMEYCGGSEAHPDEVDF